MRARAGFDRYGFLLSFVVVKNQLGKVSWLLYSREGAVLVFDKPAVFQLYREQSPDASLIDKVRHIYWVWLDLIVPLDDDVICVLFFPYLKRTIWIVS